MLAGVLAAGVVVGLVWALVAGTRSNDWSATSIIAALVASTAAGIGLVPVQRRS